MNRKLELTMYILLISLPLILIFMIGGNIYGPGTNPTSLLSLLFGFGVFYLVWWLRSNYFSEEIEFSEIDQDDSKEGYSVENRSKKSSFLNIFSSEDECDTCGTKMEYKEEMDCYYCPECREYK